MEWLRFKNKCLQKDGNFLSSLRYVSIKDMQFGQRKLSFKMLHSSHINERSSYRDPRSPNISSGLRRVVLERDESVGYGFVAAGSNAFVVQFVSPGEFRSHVIVKN